MRNEECGVKGYGVRSAVRSGVKDERCLVSLHFKF